MTDEQETRPPYRESDDHVPNRLYMTGQVDTTGTTGDVASSEAASPIFAQARAAALGGAVDQLEKEPLDTDSVILPTREKTYDEAVDDLRESAEQAEDEADSGLTPGQQEAAEEGQPVNPNALRDGTHDYGGDGPSAPATANAEGVPSDTAASADGGVPNVHPNAESVEQAEAGGVHPTVVGGVDEESLPEQGAHREPDDESA